MIFEIEEQPSLFFSPTESFQKTQGKRKVLGVWTIFRHVILFTETEQEFFVHFCDSFGNESEVHERLSSAVVDVLVFFYSLVIVLEDGKSHIWKYNPSNNSWTSQGQFQMNNSQDGTISSIVLHKKFCSFLWCEKLKSDFNNCQIFKRSVSGDTKEIKVDSIGNAQTILYNCPITKVFALHDFILMLPSPPCPPGFYLLWFPPSRIESYVMGKKRIQRNEKVYIGISFKSLAMEHLTSWINASTSIVVSETLNIHTGQLFLLMSSGDVHLLDGKKPLKSIWKISDVDLNQPVSCCTMYLFFILVLQSEIRFYSLCNGDFICTIDTSKYAISKCFQPLGIPRELYLISADGCVLKLKLKGFKELVNHKHLWPFLEKLVNTEVATFFNVESAFKDKRDWASLELLQSRNSLQNMALPVALLHLTKGNKWEKMKEIVDTFNVCFSLKSHLNEVLSPMLNWYVKLTRIVHSQF